MNKIKHTFILVSILLITSLCICCPFFNFGSTPEEDVITEPQEPVIVPEPVIQPEPEPEPEVIPEPVVIPQPEPVIEPEPIVEPEPEVIPEPIPEPEPSEDDAEYLRSINNLEGDSVTKAEFSDDKTAILQIIDELSEIMESKNADKWLTYIEPASVSYYSNITNLKKAQKKLPNKAISLNNIKDYFNYVFIPSRKRSQVDEIRYISKTEVKAVQVKDDKSIVVYYYFTKIDGKWFIHLPPIS